MSNTAAARAPLQAYLHAVGTTLQAGNATEPSYYPHLQAFLQALEPDITATSNPKRIALVAAPDFAISSLRPPTAWSTSGYIEAKDTRRLARHH